MAKKNTHSITDCKPVYNLKEYPVHPTEHNWRKTVPFALFDVSTAERRAKRNHSQSLKRLAERGGLGAVEIYCVIKDWSTSEAQKMMVITPMAQEMSGLENYNAIFII